MRLIDVERIHESDRIARHVVEAIARPNRQPKCRAASIAVALSGPSAGIFVDSPVSRLSKRMTRKPRFANPWQNSSGQAVSCMPSPMISTIGEPLRGPMASYSMSMALARTTVTWLSSLLKLVGLPVGGGHLTAGGRR